MPLTQLVGSLGDRAIRHGCPCRPFHLVRRTGGPGLRLRDQRQPRRRAEPGLARRLAPFSDQGSVVASNFGCARIQGRHLLLGGAGRDARRAAFSQPGLDLRTAGAEGSDDRAGNALDFETGILVHLDVVAQCAHVYGQLLAIDGADLLLQLIDRARLEAAPRTVCALRRIHHDVVGVQLRVLGPAGMMLETGDDQIAGHVPSDLPTLADAGRGHMLLDMGHGDLHGRPMRRDQAPVTGNLGHDRYRLGRAQGDIPARAMLALAATHGAQLLPGDLALEQRAELRAVDVASQAQRRRALALPLRRRKATLGVVVVGLVVARGLGGAGQGGDGSDHHTGPWPVGDARLATVGLDPCRGAAEGGGPGSCAVAATGDGGGIAAVAFSHSVCRGSPGTKPASRAGPRRTT